MLLEKRRPARSSHRAMSHNRRGVVYQLEEAGLARLVFEKDRSAFQGILETNCGEVISLKGHANNNEAKSDDAQLMEVLVVDGEAGTSFQLERVPVQADAETVSIQHTAINFSSQERLVGVKALRAMHQFFRPDMLGEGAEEMFVGPMRLQVIASKRTRAPSRRESLTESSDVTILELSNDFLA